jgi:hypothetical protein
MGRPFTFRSTGCPSDTVGLADIPEPDTPKANEALAAMEYAPINQSEHLKIMDRYPRATGVLALRGWKSRRHTDPLGGTRHHWSKAR